MKLPSLAIDMGSSNTRIYQLGTGVVLDEASVIAVNETGRFTVKCVGKEAKKMIGKTVDGTRVLSPVFEGKIADERAAVAMLDNFLNRVTIKLLGKRPSVLFSVPCGADNQEIKKYEKVLNECGVYNIFFVESPVLTALGADVPLTEANPCFVIDIGGGSTKIAAVSLGGVISGISVNFGGKTIDRMLMDYVEDEFGLKIGILTAERLKIQIGSLLDNDGTETVVNGRDCLTGKPRAVSIRSCDVLPPLKGFFDKVFQLAGMVMAKLPAEISADIRRSGVYFAGGVSNVVGLEDYFRFNMGIRANFGKDPSLSTVWGAGKVAGDAKILQRLNLNKR